MKKYTLKELQTIFNSRHYLSRDRFMHYFVNRYGYTENGANAAFKVFCDFPKKIHDDKSHKLLDEILPKALELVEEIQNGSIIIYHLDQKKEYKKLVYKEHDEIIEFVMDMNNSSDIISYGEILKRKIEILGMLSFCEEVSSHHRNERKKSQVFEGDIFDANDTYWSASNSNVYVAKAGGGFYRLIYIKGKGYLRNGELNIDEECSYSDHAAIKEQGAKIGNTLTDLHLLSDNNITHLKPV